MFFSPSWDIPPAPFTHEHVERTAWQISNSTGWCTRSRAGPFWDGGCRLLSEHMQLDGPRGPVGFLEEVTLRARVSPASLGGVGCREESLRELRA